MWLNKGFKQWCVTHEKFFHDHEKKNHPVYVNVHIVTLDENGHMNCSCKKPNGWGMPCPMTLSIVGELSPLMFHVRWHKAHNSEFNSSEHPKIHNLLQDMLKVNRDDEGVVHVKRH